MKYRLSAFKKSPLAIGIATLIGSAAMPVAAAGWDSGDWSVSFDSTFSLGTSIRVEDRDFNTIGKSNLPQFDWSNYNAASPKYLNSQVWANEAGAYSTNNDLGNLNFDSGKAFSTVFKGVHELDVRYKDMGVFLRGMYFYDFEMKDGERAYVNPVSGVRHDPCRSDAASDELCSDIRLLDAFFYSDFYVGDMPVSLRIGDQVISWGESTFIQHGINNVNPADITRARSPGAELKEVFIPVGMIFGSIGITDNFSISAYYQYEWERNLLPQAGSYFATNDFIGEGGQSQNIQLGFSGNPDIDLDFLLTSLNGIGNGLRTGTLDQTSALGAYLSLATKLAIRDYSDKAHIEPDSQGQYGIKATYFAEELNETEFSFYMLNYHSQRPLISGVTSNFTAASLASDLGIMEENVISQNNLTQLKAFSRADFIYPEDLKLYGFSFNTNIGETAFAAEMAYRVDEPLQIDDVELLYMAMPEQLANSDIPTVVRPDLKGISQLNNINRAVGSGETATGYIESDTMQIQATATHIFGPALGTDNLIMLAEVGYAKVMDMPDPNVVRLNGPGTHRTASVEPTATGGSRAGLHIALSDGPETNPFPTDDAWGYRLLANATYNNIFAGINLNVRATFAHDVSGTTPDPMAVFLEDRKSGSIQFNFDYLSKWSAGVAYNAYWGGLGTTNALADRDFVSFNIKYSI